MSFRKQSVAELVSRRAARTLMAGVGSVALLAAAGALDRASADGLFGDMMNAPYDWSGFYVGGQVGYIWGEGQYVDNSVPASNDMHGDGVLGGGHVGYNIQNGDGVFGVIADINFSDLDGSKSYVPVAGALVTTTYDVNLTASLRGKFGIAVTPRVLLYGTAGLAIADTDHSIAITGTALPNANADFSKALLGFTVGGGVEMAVTDWLSTFVEYRYTAYGDESFGAKSFGAVTFVTHDFELQTQQVVAGISFHFNSWMGPGS